MFGHQTPARKKLWADDSTQERAPAAMLPMPSVSFKRASSLVDAEELVRDLKAGGSAPELALVQATVDFVNSVINNNAANLNERINILVSQLKLMKESNTNATSGAFAYCTSYLATHMATCAMTNYHFGVFYNSSPLKEYLDLVQPKTLSPQKLNSSPSKR